MACYWDSSALLALIFREPGAKEARAAVSRGGLPGYTSFFTSIEMEAAYARRVAEGALNKEELPNLRLQAKRLEAALVVVWPDESVVADSKRLVLELGLRPADALQAASALLVARAAPKTQFASLDDRLNRAAQAAGLKPAW